MSTEAEFCAASEEAIDEENRWLLHGYDYVIETVALDLLQPGDSPRTAGQDEAHTQLLLERLGKLPPILVCARTMRVIDGMHRLEAARLRGAEAIEVVLVDVEEQEAYLLGVKANIAHGLPLSRADRSAAAARILRSHPDRSDRAIAQIVGLSPGTVGTIRQRSTVQNGQSNTRLGRDGRVRPATAAEGRRRAAEILAARPDLPLRRVAEESGLSLGTVHNVRRRLRDGQSPVPDAATRRRGGAGAPGHPAGAGAPGLPAGGGAQGHPAEPGAPGQPTGAGATGHPAGVDAQGRPAGAGAQGHSTSAGAPGVPAGTGAQGRPGAVRRSRRRDVKNGSWAAVRHQVIKDPAIRYAVWGRELVRWLDANAATCGEWRGQVDNIPQYWIETVIDVAVACRDEWQDFVVALEQRQRESA